MSPVLGQFFIFLMPGESPQSNLIFYGSTGYKEFIAIDVAAGDKSIIIGFLFILTDATPVSSYGNHTIQ